MFFGYELASHLLSNIIWQSWKEEADQTDDPLKQEQRHRANPQPWMKAEIKGINEVPRH